MKNNYRKAGIFCNNLFAGVLTEADDGYHFKYYDEYISSPEAQSISLTLPIRDDEYISSVFFPFFDGLIPEGWLLEMVCQNWKIDKRDRFGLLLVACKDCIGNVHVEEIG